MRQAIKKASSLAVSIILMLMVALSVPLGILAEEPLAALTVVTDFEAKTVQVTGTVDASLGDEVSVFILTPAFGGDFDHLLDSPEVAAMEQAIVVDGTIDITIPLLTVLEGSYYVCLNGPTVLERFAFDYVAATGVALDRAAATLTPGKSTKLAASVLPEDATVGEVVWASEDEGVATVDENGVVTAVAPGTTAITAETVDGGLTAACALTVRTALSMTVGTGETVIVPITAADCVKLSGLRGTIQYDESALTLQSLTAKKGFSLVSEGNRFVIIAPDGAGVTGEVVVGYAVFAAKADLMYDETTLVDFSVINANSENLAPATPFILPVEVKITSVPPMRGDVNLDGRVDVSDAIMLMQYLAGSRTLDERQLKAADVNADSKVNIGDVTIIMQMCL